MKKVFEIRIDYTETAWGSCYALVEAETKEEAKELFVNDPWAYDWDGWDTNDNEIRDWEIEDVVLDDMMTRRLQEDKEDAEVQDND